MSMDCERSVRLTMGMEGTPIVPDRKEVWATLQRTATGDGESWHRIGCHAPYR